MRFFIHTLIFFVFATPILGQNKLDKTLKKLNSESVPYIQVEEMTDSINAVLLDTRKIEEFKVSHLKNAIWVGFKEFDETMVTTKIPDQNTPVVVYCSIGVRSEIIGEKLLKLGYTNVRNLYGGIFKWKNDGNEVYNLREKATDSVHAYNKYWGKMLQNGTKVYQASEAITEPID